MWCGVVWCGVVEVWCGGGVEEVWWRCGEGVVKVWLAGCWSFMPWQHLRCSSVVEWLEGLTSLKVCGSIPHAITSANFDFHCYV